MNICAKYIQRKLAFSFAIVYFLFLSIIWLSQSLRFLEFITVKGISLMTFITVTSFLILPMSYICVPMAMFFACIITFSSLELNSEIIIFKSAGINCKQLYMMILKVLLVVFLLHLTLSLYLLPLSYQNFKNMQYELREILINSVFEEGVFNTQNNTITVYVDKKIDNFKYNNIFIYDHRNKLKPITITANFGELVETPHGAGFILHDGSHQLEDKLTKQITLGFFDTYSFIFQLNTDIAVTRIADANEMYFSELLSRTSKNPQVIENHLVHAVQRIIWPSFNLLLPAVVIIGICSKVSRRNVNLFKQLKVAASGIVIITVLIILNNLALKSFNYLYLTLTFLCVISFLITLKIRKV